MLSFTFEVFMKYHFRYNLKLKTWPKKLLDYLPLPFVLPGLGQQGSLKQVKN